MKKYIIAAVLLVASSAAAIAQSRSGYICNDNTYLSNVRAGPSAQTFSVIDQIGNGYRVIITDVTENAAGYIWAKVRYDSLRRGYPSVETGWIDGGNVCYN